MTGAFDPEPAATALIEARQARRVAGPLPAAIAPADERQAAAVQFAVARRHGAVPAGGFKIGATSPRMQGLLGLSEPAAGFMRVADIHPDAAALPWNAFHNVGVECEIGLRLRRDLGPGCDSGQAEDAVGEVFAAIEVVENRYGPPPAGDLRAVGTPTLIADQVYHAAAVIGRPGAGWRALDLAGIGGRILVDGAERDRGHGADLLGHPMRALAWLASSTVAAAFGGLLAGQVVMLGSVTAPVWLDAPGTVEVDFIGLGTARLRFVP